VIHVFKYIAFARKLCSWIKRQQETYGQCMLNSGQWFLN